MLVSHLKGRSIRHFFRDANGNIFGTHLSPTDKGYRLCILHIQPIPDPRSTIPSQLEEGHALVAIPKDGFLRLSFQVPLPRKGRPSISKSDAQTILLKEVRLLGENLGFKGLILISPAPRDIPSFKKLGFRPMRHTIEPTLILNLRRKSRRSTPGTL
ncbi:MAG: hypothetical protein U1C71_02615 [archaeon]|nr:hypothetical protein [archaeon]